MDQWLNDAQSFKKGLRNPQELVAGETYFANAYVKNGAARIGYFHTTREGAERGARWSGLLNARLRVKVKVKA